MRLTLAILALTLSGCFVFFEEHGKGGDDDVCAQEDAVPGDPRSALAPQRNPDLLTCETLGVPCNPECGTCPLGLAPIPSWGFCGTCEFHDEAACEADSACRVVKDARCAIDGTCLTDYLGCVATDQFVDSNIDCTTVTDATSCSMNPACTAYHTADGCSISSEQSCVNQFEFCGPEGRGAGKCFEQAACDRAPPECPLGTTPGVMDGCYTDTCIPNDLCEPLPN